MGKRLKLYTKSGDKGRTYSPIIGDYVPKDHPTIELEGALDETLSYIGLARSLLPDELSDVDSDLADIQRLFFRLGTTVLTKGSNMRLTEDDVKRLEEVIDSRTPEDSDIFVIPSGHPSSTAIHLARSSARRFERLLVRIVREYGLELGPTLKIANRVSDALFSLALHVNRRLGFKEDIYKPSG